jgi:hypothetical protein
MQHKIGIYQITHFNIHCVVFQHPTFSISLPLILLILIERINHHLLRF